MVVPVYFDPKTERPVLWSLGTFRLATVAQLTAEPKSPDSIWPAFRPGEFLRLAEGLFVLSAEGDLVPFNPDA